MSMGNNYLPDPFSPNYKPTINWGKFFSGYREYCHKHSKNSASEVDKVLQGFFISPRPKNETWDGYLDSLR